MLYDQAGNLISEVDADTGRVLAEYIWLDGTPLAFVQSGQTYHVHVDHLGTPKALTDSTGNLAWEATHSPFGKATITSQGPTFNLRFPGQYYDAETGLHYNWRRYYDPNTGRYITSDPIGLAGGINTYAYALSNPIGNADPTGEFVPLLLGAYAAVEVALSAWDAYDTYQTITSDCATTGEKWISGGLFTAGVFLPGNYGWMNNAAKRLKPHSISNEATRKWYHQQLDSISSQIDSTLPIRDQALTAFKQRNEIKLQARDLMADRKTADSLPPPKALKDVVRKAYNQGLRGDDVWKYVLGGSQRSNTGVDTALGLSR